MSSNDDDQLGELKDWWQRNGKPLVTGGMLALVVVFGWQFWHKYQTNQSQGASILYQQLLETTLTPDGQPDVARVADLANKLKSEYAGSAYAQFGGLFVAKVAVDNGKLDDAAAELKAIVDKPANGTLAEVARQRLAQVLAAQKAKTPEPPEGLTRIDFYGKSGDTYLVPKGLDVKAEWEKHKKDHHFAQHKETVWPRDFIAHAIAHLDFVKSDIKTETVVSLT